MNLQEKQRPDPAVLWTRQVEAVAEELRTNGVYRVRKEYVQAKNDSIADFYIRLYRWYTREAGKYIRLPEAAEFPIWLSVSEESMLRPTEGTVTFRLEIPAERYLLCNYDAWGYCVNYWYVPLDDGDQERHLRELARYGLKSDDELFLTDKGNFYPLLKRKVQDSWKRVFTLPPENEVLGLVATAWELREEWIRDIEYYGGK